MANPPTGTDEKMSMDLLIDQGKLVRDKENQKDLANDMVRELLENLTDDEKREVLDVLTEKIEALDAEVEAQVNEIMHHPDFQKLEASWRGLNYLVMNTETSTMLKLRLLNVTKKELFKDLKKAVEFDQSNLFKKVYEEEYGTFGGKPYGVLIGDFEFGPAMQDVEMLTLISNVAAMAHAPFIASANNLMFDLGSFEELPSPRDLAKKFEAAEFIKWNSFRATEDSRYVSLVLPRYLARVPYGNATVPVENMVFEETVDGRDHSKYLWGNSAFLLAQRITNAFALHSWLAAIRGVEGGGLVEDMALHLFKTDEGDTAIKCPTETAITDRRENELNNLGFIALVHRKADDKAAFFGSRTANRPKKYDTAFANANAGLSATLSYLLCASRFAHYIKSIMRDKIGSFMTRGQVETYLTRWISNYILLDDDAPQAIKAKYPLREARIDVVEVPGKAGAYKATVFLRPHFQLEELTTSIRLVAELPPPAA